jgi:hypothetical protein
MPTLEHFPTTRLLNFLACADDTFPPNLQHSNANIAQSSTARLD